MIQPLRFSAPTVCLNFHGQIRLIIADNAEITLLNQIVSTVRNGIEDIWELDETRSVFAYDDIVRHWILQLKFYGKENLSPLLGRLLTLSFQNSNWLEKYDFLIPIPLHSSRLRKRGFNQSLLLAYYFKKNLGKSAPELQTHWLRRIRATRPQTELPLAERLVNMDDAFETSLEVQNHQILLLDDVMTTGSTLNAAARCLKEAGASSVGALVLGRKMWDSFEDGFPDA